MGACHIPEGAFRCGGGEVLPCAPVSYHYYYIPGYLLDTRPCVRVQCTATSCFVSRVVAKFIFGTCAVVTFVWPIASCSLYFACEHNTNTALKLVIFRNIISCCKHLRKISDDAFRYHCVFPNVHTCFVVFRFVLSFVTYDPCTESHLSGHVCFVAV